MVIKARDWLMIGNVRDVLILIGLALALALAFLYSFDYSPEQAELRVVSSLSFPRLRGG